jgi:NAD(P)-dependent dehydrogenase (short-subunit alcohol dehydrogenase family)
MPFLRDDAQELPLGRPPRHSPTARYRVRVNAVAPGVTRTGMTSGVSDELLADVPLRRIAEPEEIADAVLWLAGGTYTTGTVLTVDGGYTAR